MIKLCYFNIFFTPVYFLLYFQNTTDYLLIGGFIVLITFSVLLLKQEINLRFKNNVALFITGILSLALLIKALWSLFSLLQLLDLEYLAFRTGSYAFLTAIFCITIGLQLTFYIKKISVREGIDNKNKQN